MSDAVSEHSTALEAPGAQHAAAAAFNLHNGVCQLLALVDAGGWVSWATSRWLQFSRMYMIISMYIWVIITT